MNIIKLTHENQSDLEKLISEIEKNLPRKEYWLPITKIEREHFLDDEWTAFYGIYHEGELIAASALFYNECEFGETINKLGMETKGVAEIGRCMVKPSHRGNKLLISINDFIIQKAKREGLQYIVATVYPDNIPSYKSFMALGFEKQTTYVRNSTYVRDVFLLKI